MEEKKKLMWKKIAWRTINVILALLVFVGIFALSVSAGICSVIFSAVGFVFGYFCRHHKMQQKFFDALLEGKEDFFNGKVVTVMADDENGSISVHVSEATEDPSDFSLEVGATKNPKKKKKEKRAEKE